MKTTGNVVWLRAPVRTERPIDLVVALVVGGMLTGVAVVGEQLVVALIPDLVEGDSRGSIGG